MSLRHSLPRLLGRLRERGAPSAYLLLAVAALCWAGNFVMGRAVHNEIPPVALTFWRWVVAGAVLLPFGGASVWRLRIELGRQWRRRLMLAVTGIVLFHLFVYTGLHTTSATIAATAETTLAIGYVALFASVLAYIFKAITYCAVSRAGDFGSLSSPPAFRP